MHAYGFSIKSLALLLSYLTGRYQRVKISSAFSKWIEIVLGIPQGSILGPLLFNIFINDIFYFILETDICNFADDNTLYACDTSFESARDRLNNDLRRIILWFRNNSMVANPGKFQLMFLGGDVPSDFSICVSDQKIPVLKEVELLGVIIDSRLTFSNHIKRVCKYANIKTCALMRIRHALSITQAKTILNAYILPYFFYCPVIWMFCKKSSMDIINKTHKRALRTVYNDVSLSLPELLALDNASSIHTRHLQILMVEVYKTLHQTNPKLLWDIFCFKNVPYNLRATSLVKLPSARTVTYGTNSLQFKASLIWNGLPNDIKSCENVIAFKRKIKLWNGESCSCTCCK